MSSTELHSFCHAALQSQLLSAEQLEEAVVILRDAGATEGAADPQEDIERLARQLISMGYLNRWQVDQLKAGRTKFSLGPYRILDSIGRGGMGHVFKGQHSMLGRVEAVKVLPKSHTSPDSIERFQHEIRAQAQLDHPNLVRVSYAGRDGETYFFVTEYVSGSDLRSLVRNRTCLSMEEAATIVSQVAKALEYAHQRGLVHRDIKPGNVLVTPEGFAKVTDLGLAGFMLEDELVESPHRGKIVGTADYLAPDAIRKPGEVSPLNDIYALGCTLYYAVTGKAPFPGGTTAEKMQRHCDQTPINPKRFNSELSDAFLDVIAAMMAKDAGERVQSAGEVVERLAPWILTAAPVEIGRLESKTTTPGASPPPLPPGARSRFEDSQVTTSDCGEPGSFSGAAFPGAEDSQSQISQSTDPIHAEGEETMPISAAPSRAGPVSAVPVSAMAGSVGLPEDSPGEQIVARRTIPFVVWFLAILFLLAAVVSGVVWLMLSNF